MCGHSCLLLAVNSRDILLHVDHVSSESVLYGLIGCEMVVLTVREVGIGPDTGSSHGLMVGVIDCCDVD